MIGSEERYLKGVKPPKLCQLFGREQIGAMPAATTRRDAQSCAGHSCARRASVADQRKALHIMKIMIGRLMFIGFVRYATRNGIKKW